MKNKTKYNQNILSIALKRQAKMQRAVGTNWWFNKSKSYKVINVLYWLSFALTLTINFFLVSGVAYWNSRASESAVITAKTQFVTVFIIGTAVLIFSVILRRIMKKIETIETRILLSRISCMLILLSSIFMVLSAYNVLILQTSVSGYATPISGESGDMFSRYMQLVFYHILPLFIMSLTTFLLHITVRSNFKEINYYYDKVMSKAYNEYVEANPDYTEEMWNEYIDSYKDTDEEIMPLKRSKKSKNRKKNKEDKKED